MQNFKCFNLFCKKTVFVFYQLEISQLPKYDNDKKSKQLSNHLVLRKLFIMPIKMTYTIQMTSDRPIHRLNYQWKAIIHFYRPIVGQYDVICYWHVESFILQSLLSLSFLSFSLTLSFSFFLYLLYCYTSGFVPSL